MSNRIQFDTAIDESDLIIVDSRSISDDFDSEEPERWTNNQPRFCDICNRTIANPQKFARHLEKHIRVCSP